ncbi:MAG: hypothetical protein GX575_23000 [Candidatus Anammoximicrobium sp.]|nr:hypothetical protein [Candidatus Anammoximicrobium sp.]
MVKALWIPALSLLASQVPVPAGGTEDFRVETDVFLGGEKEPVAQNVTLFSGGLVYDFPLIGPQEITVFDGARGRFVLLDVPRKIKSTLTTQELLQTTAAIKIQAQGLDGLFAFAADPQFQGKADDQDGWLTLSSSLLSYRAKGIKPKLAATADVYRDFADWHARLNATRPGNLPPFPRLELNRTLAERQQVPEEVELTVEPKSRWAGRKLVVRSHHIFNWRLSNTDRKRIETAGTYMADFQAVSFQDYRLPLLAAGKPDAR